MKRARSAIARYFREFGEDMKSAFAPDPRNQDLSAERVHIKHLRLLSGYAFELRGPGGSMVVTEREARQLRRMLGVLFPADLPATEEKP